jgi:hypothetical protein
MRKSSNVFNEDSLTKKGDIIIPNPSNGDHSRNNNQQTHISKEELNGLVKRASVHTRLMGDTLKNSTFQGLNDSRQAESSLTFPSKSSKRLSQQPT